MKSQIVFRVFVISTILLALIALPVPQGVYAQSGVPALCTGFQLQNTNSLTGATVSLSFYGIGDASPGTSDYTASNIPIPAGGSFSAYVPSTYSTLPSGAYAVVVSSDLPLNSLVNQVDCGAGGLNVGASHSGVQSLDTGNIVYLPFAMSRAFGAQSWSSTVAIQNAGSTTANVKIEFFKSGQSTPTDTFTNTTLAVGETWYLDLSTGQYATAALANFSGAAKITSNNSVPVAAVTNYAPADGSRLLSYNGVTTAGQVLYATQVTRNFAAGLYQGGLTLYNLAATSTPITIDFYSAGQTTPTYSKPDTIAGNSAYILYMGPGGPLDGITAMNNFNGSAVVRVTSGPNQLVGIFNLNSAAGAAGAANMMVAPTGQTTYTVSFPQIVRSFGSGPFESGWQIVNAGNDTANLDMKYTRSTGAVVTSTTTLGAGAALSVYVGGGAGAALGTGWNGSLTITSDQPIVGQANFINVGAGAKDSLLIYNGFNN